MDRTVHIAHRTRHDPATGCLVWTASTNATGYAHLSFRGRQHRANRFVWETMRGPIPDGLHVLHRCDNRRCVNIDHLFLGTNDDNVADKVAKGRQSRGAAHRAAVVRGETHGGAKFSETDARAILADARPLSAIAAQYGVAKSTICRVKKGVRWGHLKA